MKKFFQIIGICSILVFSFYYTDKIAILVQNKNPVLQEIKNKEEQLCIDPVNASIENDYIIPGSYGSKVNVEKSFYNMKALKTFNEYYLIYDDIKPTVSIEDNKDKIIIRGNTSKRQISIVLEDNSHIALFKNYKVNQLVTKDAYIKNNNLELINNESDKKLFNQVNTLLNNDKINKHLCLVNDNNKEICQKNGNYLIKNSLTLTSKNIVDVKRNIDNGQIILIKSTAKESDIKILLEEIKFKDLEIVYLSNLISEKNT